MAEIKAKIELVDALLDTINKTSMPQKELAIELDYSRSRLSQITANPECFPLLKTPKLMRITDNIEILETLADMFGFRLVPKEISVADLIKTLSEKLQIQSDVIADALQDLRDFNIRTYDHMRKSHD